MTELIVSFSGPIFYTTRVLSCIYNTYGVDNEESGRYSRACRSTTEGIIVFTPVGDVCDFSLLLGEFPDGAHFLLRIAGLDLNLLNIVLSSSRS